MKTLAGCLVVLLLTPSLSSGQALERLTHDEASCASTATGMAARASTNSRVLFIS
jgi:hypothetical protein